MQIEYRNCNYIGDFNFNSYQRQGYGMVVLDNSQIIMARWKSDMITGPFAIITDRIRALGTMNNNKLEGYNVISLQQSLVSNKREKQRTVYGMFRENKIYGKALIIDDQDVVIAHYTDGKLREISQKKPIRDREVYDMLKICFPNETYNIWDWLTQIFQKASKSETQSTPETSSKYQLLHKNYQNDIQFYGYTELFSNNKAFGFTMHQGQVISIGDHQRDYLQGIGRLYHSDGTVQDGVFKNGQLCGIGISYNRKSHKFILGEHNQDNQEFQKGFGFPQKEISEIRKQFHLRSINFYNDIVLFSFSTLFQSLISNCLQYSLQHQSPRFSSNNPPQSRHQHGLPQKSPLRAKLSQYQQQSDHIDQPSPIKNKPINQYDRTDHRRSKYFDNNGNQEVQPSQSRSKSKSNSQRKVEARGKESQSRSTHNRKLRDTKQFVRELDQKQKSRRSYLDQIYKEARLYNRKN